jgi:cholesterol oxidase
VIDVIVVGSGFGGSVAALRAAEKGYRVLVLEAGRRWRADDFPRTNWNLRRYLWAPRLGLRGIQRVTLLRDVLVLSGAGVGGGSLVYANVLHEPRERPWLGGDELDPHYATARRMLGSTRVPWDTPADEVLRRVAARMGVADTFRRADVGVFFGEPGVEVADPYFGGAGPTRRGCIACGGCMVGCRHGAKNSLDRNYLHLAEALGAEILPEREALRLERVEDGWEVVTRRPGWGRREQRFRAPEVVLAAGVLGTLGLLFDSRLPGISERLGDDVRTNSEAIVGAATRSLATDYSTGLAIGSSFEPSPDTQVQPVRYPRGANAMGLLATLLVDGGGRVPRPLRFLGTVARHPLRFLQSLSVRRWSERSIIVLVMQSRPSALRVRPRRRGGLTSARSGGERPPRWIPEANEAARLTAEELGGHPGSSLSEVLLDVPTTAHLLGGACIGDTKATGAIDGWHRVFGCPGLHVVDGAAVSANLGVNPALTIAAQAERALAHWPNRGTEDPRPPLGAPYVRLPVVPAERPAVPAPPGAITASALD